MNYKLTLVHSVFILLAWFIVQIVFLIINGVMNDLFKISLKEDIIISLSYITIFVYYISKYKINVIQWFSGINYREVILYIIFFTSVMVVSTFIKFIGLSPTTAAVHASQQVTGYTSTADLLKDIFVVCGTVVLLPVMEEIFFRGLIFNGLVHKYNFWIAILASSALFAFVHTFTDLKHFMGVFLSGICFALVFYLTGNIFYSILGHIINNLLAFIFAYMSRYHPNNKLVVISDGGFVLSHGLVMINAVIFLASFIYIALYRYRQV